jgi:hypothetical protein
MNELPPLRNPSRAPAPSTTVSRSLWCCCNQFDYTLFLLKFLA